MHFRAGAERASARRALLHLHVRAVEDVNRKAATQEAHVALAVLERRVPAETVGRSQCEHACARATHTSKTGRGASPRAWKPAPQSTQLLCCGPDEVTSGQSAMPSIALE